MILYIFAIVYLTTMMGNMGDEIKATKLPSALGISGIIQKIDVQGMVQKIDAQGMVAPGRMSGIRLYCCFSIPQSVTQAPLAQAESPAAG